jgi:transcription elongation GreA/GreB family factor
MSQAFVKETDPADELPDREISPHPNYVTAEGLALIEARVAEFQRDYAAAQAGNDPEQIDRPRLARAARELRYWTARRQSAQLVPPAEDDGRIRFGSRVTLNCQGGEAGERSYRIVGEDEADPAQGSLSYVSPLARALIGKEEGDRVTIGAGDGAKEFEIVRVRA